MASEDVKIIGSWLSPFALRARIALNLKGVEYEYVEENLAAKSDLLLKSNPVYKKVPVLLHNGRPISESTVILQYIDDVWASQPGAAPLLPADPYDRAIHRFWAHFIDDKCLASFINIVKAQAQAEDAKKEAFEQVQDMLKLLEEAFDACSKGKNFFNGDEIGYLDIVLGSFLGSHNAVEQISGLKLIDAERTPLLAGWAERFYAHEAVKVVMPETEKLVQLVVNVLLPILNAPPASN